MIGYFDKKSNNEEAFVKGVSITLTSIRRKTIKMTPCLVDAMKTKSSTSFIEKIFSKNFIDMKERQQHFI